MLGSSYLETLEVITSKAAQHGLLVLLACHRIRAHYGGKSLHSEWPGNWDGLWFEQASSDDDDDLTGWTEDAILDSWRVLSERFCNSWNVLGVDLMVRLRPVALTCASCGS